MNEFIKFHKTRIAHSLEESGDFHSGVEKTKSTARPTSTQNIWAEQSLQMKDPTTKISNLHLNIILMKHNKKSMQYKYNHPARKKNDFHR